MKRVIVSAEQDTEIDPNVIHIDCSDLEDTVWEMMKDVMTEYELDRIYVFGCRGDHYWRQLKNGSISYRIVGVTCRTYGTNEYEDQLDILVKKTSEKLEQFMSNIHVKYNWSQQGGYPIGSKTSFTLYFKFSPAEKSDYLEAEMPQWW